MWDRIRYTAWAPVYDRVAGIAAIEQARRRSIERLNLRAGDRVLIVGAGTGLDLPFFPVAVDLTAIDVTPAMLARLEVRAAELGLIVSAHLMDARQLAFPDCSFDAVIMHLVVAVMPEPERGVREAARVLRPGGRVALFDKFLGDREPLTTKRRLLNLIAKPLFSDMNRRLGPLVASTSLVTEHDEPSAFGGLYRIVTLVKPDHANVGDGSSEGEGI